MVRLPLIPAALVTALTAAIAYAATPAGSNAAAPSGHYSVQAAHTQVLFSILHAELTHYYGRFDRVSGDLAFNAQQPEKSSVSIAIDTTSVSTPSDQLNAELKTDLVLNAASFPLATFKSTAIRRTGSDSADITGDLTLRGVTRTVTLHATFNGARRSALGNVYELGFSATAQIKRSDFGMTQMRWASAVGDTVDLVIEAAFVQDMV